MKHFFYYNEIKLEINNRTKSGQFTNMKKLKKHSWQPEDKDITWEIKKYFEINKNVNRAYKIYGMQPKHCSQGNL